MILINILFEQVSDNKSLYPPPEEHQLSQNYTTPFNLSKVFNPSSVTTIYFALPKSDKVWLAVMNWWNYYTVKNLIDRTLHAGNYKVTWNVKNDNGQYVTNNLYRFQLTSSEFSNQKEFFINISDPEHTSTSSTLFCRIDIITFSLFIF